MDRGTVQPHFRITTTSWLLALLLIARGAAFSQESGPRPAPEAENETLLPQPPAAAAYRPIWEAAHRAAGPKLVVSIDGRRLWYMDGTVVLFTAPVAVGRPVVLEYEGSIWNFTTPRGRRTVLRKERNPVWVPPDWHYVELALLQGWKLERLLANRPFQLTDGSHVVVRAGRVGRLFAGGRFEPVPPGEETVFDATLFIPPIGSANRRIHGQLGRFKLDLGDAYYLHGTPDSGSVGRAVTHGCIRLHDEDIEFLFHHVPVGTPVFLY